MDTATEIKDEPPKIKFRFCRECSNLLYPKEDKTNERLLYACRTCHYSEVADNPMVYATDHSASAGETAGITQDVGSDPTVGDVFDMPLCTMCGQEIMCAICGEAPAEGGMELEVDDYDPDLEDPEGLQKDELGSSSPSK